MPEQPGIKAWDATVLAIMGHTGCEPTLDDFMPRWNSFGIPVVGCWPEGQVTDRFRTTIIAGRSAHKGSEVFRRFTETLRALLDFPAHNFIVAEYDTVPIRKVLPDMPDGQMACPMIRDDDSFGIRGNVQLGCLSPWTFDRPTLVKFVEACDHCLPMDGEMDWFGGLLDRWIATVACRHGFNVANNKQVAYHAPSMGVQNIRQGRYTWVHGWKLREDFGQLWDLWDATLPWASNQSP